MSQIAQKEAGTVAVVIVTWNGWQDALECLDSVFRSTYPKFHVIVCDNDSQRVDCLGKIEAWARGEEAWELPASSPLAREGLQPSRRPETIERVHYPDDRRSAALHPAPLPDLLLVQTGKNLGYAGGNNVGFRYALEHPEISHIWVLNPDTVVEPDAMQSLMDDAAVDQTAGLIGVALLDYDKPETLQVMGGGRWIARTSQTPRLKANETYDPGYDYGQHAGEITWIHGASTFVPRRTIETVGPMSEIYFLYCEEVDWAERVCKQSTLGISGRSRVYHKASTDQKSRFSWRRWYCVNRSKIIFTAKFYPWSLPSILGIVLRNVWGRFLTVIRPYYVVPAKRMLTLLGLRR